ncbi:glycoside hydrolase family 2 protein [Thiothrix subterranea]|uniref:Glycoside hydrolase family 2 TIM barrel-domain containing protein n=1 Tax=Thiothrix subterranea TaxID=2735563 RepID=A0AA51MKS4_9GAMM|nr:sugar-binding domain-containing protein [Thiothrix subterranea]MDQ5769249.1 glycoside hydrolase family 2 TIM barrel-domain containing protein [Thiothrix subterranea]WML86232.1 glycoside hydrolase family 2 TIM barrel-domain containing protein [Thiothrix subterranea]
MKRLVWAVIMVWVLLLQGCSSIPSSQPDSVSKTGSLAGQWEFLPSGSEAMPAAKAVWQTINVPGNWYTQGYDHHGVAWYRLKFNANTSPETVSTLHFGGVDYFAAVWLNGQKLGEHEGYFQAFAFDVSQHLKADENILLVRVNSPQEKAEDYSLRKRLIKGIFAHHDTRPGGAWSDRGQEQNTGGIWGEVRLQQSQQVQLAPQRVQVQPVKGLEQWQVLVDLDTLGALPADAELQWSVEPMGFVEEGVCNTPLQCPRRGVLHTPSSTILIHNPKLWNPHGYGDPNLYKLTVSAVHNGTVLDSFERTIGFRKIRRSPQEIWSINDQRIQLKGTNYIANQWLSDMTSADFRRDIQLMLDANINTVRVHAHVTAPEFYRLCDEMGLMVWQDFPLQWGYQDTPEFHQQAVSQVGDMIRQFGQYTSIIQWTLHNEPPWDADWMKWKYKDYNPQQNKVLDNKLHRAALALEKTRPISMISSTKEHPWLGWYSGHWLDYAKPTKTATIAEFGAQALPDKATLRKILGHEAELPTTDAAWDEWAFHNFQRKETLEIAKVPQGKTLDEFIDNTQQYQARLNQLAAESYRRQAYRPVGALFQFMLVEDWASMNWGMVDFWRKPKPGYYALQRAYQPILPSLAWSKVDYAAGETITFGAWALNDSTANYPNARYDIKLLRDKQTLDTQTWAFNLTADMHQYLRDYTAPMLDAGEYLLETTIHDAQGKLLSSNEYRFTVQPQQ